MDEIKNNLNDSNNSSYKIVMAHHIKNYGQSGQEDNRYALMHAVLYDMTYGTFENCTLHENSTPNTPPAKIIKGGEVKLHVTPNTGYALHNDCFTVTNAEFNYADGYLTISNPTGDVSVSASAEDNVDYLCMTLLTQPTTNDGLSIRFQPSSSYSPGATIYYSIDKKTWNTINTRTGPTLTNVGDKVYFRGNNNSIGGTSYYNYFVTSGSGTISLSGDLTTIIHNQGNVTNLSSYKEGIFAYLFRGLTSLTTAENLILPSTTLNSDCYYYMFNSCTNLVTAPHILPATTLTSWCYLGMFLSCTSLVTAPELPALNLSSSCYRQMFQYCTNLIDAPELHATNLSEQCYQQMFYGCTSLSNISSLPATTLASSCYSSMFNGCTSLISAPKIFAQVGASNSCDSMFYGCTNLTSIPNHIMGYSHYMFYNCTKIKMSTIYSSTYKNKYAFYSYDHADYMFTGTSGSFKGTPTYGLFYTSNQIVEAIEDFNICAKSNNCSIQMKTFGEVTGVSLEYSIDNIHWTPFVIDSTIIMLSNIGDKVYFRGNNSSLSIDNDNYTQFVISGNVSLNGDITYLINKKGSIYDLSEYNSHTFARLFENCSSITDVENLVLPSLTLSESCYFYMFSNCTGITKTPRIDAQTLNTESMYYMFSGCSSLNFVQVKFTDWAIDSQATLNWLQNVSSTGVFKNPEGLAVTYTESTIPTGWSLWDGYLCFIATADSSYIKMIRNSSSAPELELKYSYDLITWANFAINTNINATTIGTKIYIKGYNAGFGNSSYYNYFVTSTLFNIEGDITTLLDENGNENMWGYRPYTFSHLFQQCNITTFPAINTPHASPCGFISMFYRCTSLITAPVLSATTLESSCYSAMFNGCTALINAPALPATNLAYACYNSMFDGCSSLTTAPALPATTLAEYCYNYMFNGCTSLVNVPVLPAITLSDNCYQCMFSGCTSIITAPTLPATIVKIQCYNQMFKGCTNLVNAPELPATTIESTSHYCYQRMFEGCTSLVTAPALPATTLSQYCYSYMFSGCTNLVNIPVILPATTLANNCYYYMFSGCTSLVSAPELPATTLDTYCYDCMFYGCSSLTNAPALPATTLSYYCYYGMFQGCTSLVNAPALPATKAESYCYALMFYGCTALTTAPALPATTLAYYCYLQMFSGCTNLVNAPELTATNLYQYCYDLMFYGCTSLTTAPALPATTLADYCYYEMFEECTNLTNAPVLSATTLNNSCYSKMFYKCTSLVNAPALPATTLAQYCYNSMFDGCSSLTNAPALPATTLTPYCYQYMFNECNSLVNAPELPATTLTTYCYTHMFYGCVNLVNAPALPATTLTTYCYQQMFGNCTSLTATPELPATTLANYCYYEMFFGCTSLVNISELPATNAVERCYYGMFKGCTSLVTTPVLPATTVSYYCYAYMFYNCTNLETIASLPAKSLVGSCYYQMYYNCSKLKLSATQTEEYVNAYTFGTTPSKTYAEYMFTGTGGTFKGTPTRQTYYTSNTIIKPIYPIKFKASQVNSTISMEAVESAPALTLQYSTDKETWNTFTVGTTTVTLANVNDIVYFRGTNSTLATSTSDYNHFVITGGVDISDDVTTLIHNDGNIEDLTSYGDYTFCGLFKGCTNVTFTDIKLPSKILKPHCYDSMFMNSSIITRPSFVATTLVEGCYSNMFMGCTSLTTTASLVATTLANSCYSNMFNGCTSLTSIPNISATTLQNNCCEGMFNGCTGINTSVSLSATTLADNCYKNMFTGCSNIPSASIRATSIAYNSCLQEMFKNCTSLAVVSVSFTDWSTANNATTDWLSNVASTGTFKCLTDLGTNETITRGDSYCPTNWTVSNPSYSIDLNNGQWVDSGTTVEGKTVYKSTNQELHSTTYYCTITISGYTEFTVNIRSYAESTYDYTIAYALDSTSTSKATTSGKQSQTVYTPVVYSGIDGGTHTIRIAYKKDGSASSGDDTGYFYISS